MGSLNDTSKTLAERYEKSARDLMAKGDLSAAYAARRTADWQRRHGSSSRRGSA